MKWLLILLAIWVLPGVIASLVVRITLERKLSFREGLERALWHGPWWFIQMVWLFLKAGINGVSFRNEETASRTKSREV